MARFAYYIYYRISPGRDVHILRAVQKAQTEVAAATGAEARLLVKRDEPDLWMEVYEGIADAVDFERALAAAVERHALAMLVLDGTSRKTETFVESPCA